MTKQSEAEPAPARNVFEFEAMIPTGILWLINRTIFHPRGLALALSVGAGEGEARGWEIVASPDGTPYRYDDDQMEAAKHRAVEELLDLVRINGVMPPKVEHPAEPGESVEVQINHDRAPWAGCCDRTDPHPWHES